MLAHLLRDMARGSGFVQLTGNAGTGKTTLCNNLRILLPENLEIAQISNQPRLLWGLCNEFRLKIPEGYGNSQVMLEHIETYLLETEYAGRHRIVIIDEAQNLGLDALEELRLLSARVTGKRNLLGIILIGQPELRSLLMQPELHALAQRITAQYHLDPLNEADTFAYVRHLLRVAGSAADPFTEDALHHLFKLTRGVPRSINRLCGRAMLTAYGKGLYAIDHHLLHQVARELDQHNKPQVAVSHRWTWGLAGVLGIALSITFWLTRVPDHTPESVLQPSLTDGSVSEAANEPPAGRQPLSEAPESTGTGDTQATAEVSGHRGATTATTLAPSVASESDRAPATTPQSAAPAASPTRAASIRSATENLAIAVPPDLSPRVRRAIKLPTPEPDPVARRIEDSLHLTGQHDDIATAFATLFDHWQSDYSATAEGSACDKAREAGLQCLFGRGDWEELHYYNRPAVIELLLDGGKRYHVVVSALDAEQATLSFGARQARISQDEFEAIWSGSYILFWRPPEMTGDELRTDSQGPAVHWLRETLGRVDGRSAGQFDDPTQASFDWRLSERVLAFQRSVGLTADGIVGRNTLIKLNTAARSPGIPVLWNEPRMAPSGVVKAPARDEHLPLHQAKSGAEAGSTVPREAPNTTASTDETGPLQTQTWTTQPEATGDEAAQALLNALLDAELAAESAHEAPLSGTLPVATAGDRPEGPSTAETRKPPMTDPVESAEPDSEPPSAQATPTAAASGALQADELIPSIKDLPKSRQILFENLQIVIHFYHEIPEARFVMIGNRRYREGDVLDHPGFRLVRISPKWVIIDYGDGLVRM
ncbi:MAG: AAA family ATPase [Gammaproteobacteria bacterium]|nr:AAA family ATPase [Gammaproteobacteria bacterium]